MKASAKNDYAREQPHDDASERAALNVALSYGGYIDRLTPDLFYNKTYRNVCEVAKAVSDGGGGVDIATVSTYSKKHGWGIDFDTLAYITGGTPSAGAFDGYLATLADLRQRRELLRIAAELENTAYDPTADVPETLAGLRERVGAAEASTQAKNYRIDPERVYPDPDYLFEAGGVRFLPRGDLAAVKAKQKSGKTMFCCLLAASLFGSETFGLKSLADSPKVLFFDTEQAEADAAKVAQRVKDVLGWNAKDLDNVFAVYALRSTDTPGERLAFITSEVRKEKPCLAFIDGVVDVCPDFNDNVESLKTIRALMRLASECGCALVCILHTNKGKDDDNMRGHLGTMLAQKAAEVWEVAKDAPVFTATQTDTRHRPVSPIRFAVDGHGTPCSAFGIWGAAEAAKAAEQIEVMRKVFAESPALSYKELCGKVCEVAGVKYDAARKRAERMLKLGVILKDDETGLYRCTQCCEG